MLVLIIGLHVASVGTEQIQTIFLYKVFLVNIFKKLGWV